MNTQILATDYSEHPDFSNNSGISRAVDGMNKILKATGDGMKIKLEKLSQGTLIAFKIVTNGNASDVVPQNRVYNVMKFVRRKD